MRFETNRLDGETEHWRLQGAADEVSFGEVISRWADDPAFRSFWHARLRSDVPFPSYCWECPPVAIADRHRPFECVFVSSPLLAGVPADSTAFKEHFREGIRVTGFESIGRDAWLISPCPEGPDSDFGHLGRFLRTAGHEHADALWRAVGDAMAARLNERPIWLSTAGLGVPWLHVRLDSRPKYYRHRPYLA